MEQKPARLIILFALCTAALLPLMLMRDATVSNELRYLSIADEALRDGHLFAFYNHGVPYADKPPLFFWLMMAGKLLFGSHCLLYLSLLSLIPAFVTVAVLDRWCAPALPAGYRTAAAVALLSTFYFAASAVTVRMDMLMTMFITLALYSFYRMYEGDGRLRWRIAFPVFVFLAIFSKGAVGFLVPLLCVPAFLLAKKQLRTVGRYWGWLTWGILALLCGFWFFMAYREGGADYLRNLLLHQTVDRAVDAFDHKAPVYYYFLHFWYIMFPWCVLVAGSIVTAFVRCTTMDDRARFLACSAAVILLILSLVSSKLDIYFLPAAGLAVYAAFMLLPGIESGKSVRWMMLVPLVLAAVAMPAAYFITRTMTDTFAGSLSPWMFIVLEAGIIAAVAAAFRGNVKSAVFSFAAGLYLAVFVFGLQVKQVNPYIGYHSLCEHAMAAAEEKGIDRYVLATYADGVPMMSRGENADVYLGRSLELVPLSVIENSADSLVGDTNGIIVFTITEKNPTFAVYGND
ncbi:MAG: glycosyltransferase family 39 protein [Bacteroidales bacterium]|nr:glycosyltransferase family 39 protein [Bacteroidales bacterium]